MCRVNVYDYVFACGCAHPIRTFARCDDARQDNRVCPPDAREETRQPDHQAPGRCHRCEDAAMEMEEEEEAAAASGGGGGGGGGQGDHGGGERGGRTDRRERGGYGHN
ncbi:hypothetical protein SPI_08100 [Niveomyces insectorum RCEF 264]|uniref:Uncharacterized protein n=1 Tax=Niveomyces insectorum RCEF 264 TaxID=1081102 RepID=A0A167NTC2_9HYPO|nr:hypothetical protein SPI_08100 [Niveomyces insectorum RCEF 264]